MKSRLFQAFSERSFSLLWLSEIFTILAFNLFNFILLLHVYSLTHSNIAVAFVVVSFTLPAILFGILAGVYVDRWSKKRVLLISNLIRGMLLIFLAIFHQSLIAIYIISFLVALVTQFFVPAETPIIPLIVRKDLLYSANALFGLGLYGGALFAYLLSGPLILFAGEVNTLIILGVMFFVSSLFISGINIESKSERNKKGILGVSKSVLLKEIRAAVSVMRNSREIYNSIFLLAVSQTLLLVLAAIAPGYASQILKISIQEFPLIFIVPAAIGVLVGALILVTLLHERSKEKLTTLGLFLSGAAMLLLPYGSRISAREIVHDINNFLPHFLDFTTIHFVIVLAFILGLANAFVFVPSNTILLEKTKDEFRGKIYGVLSALVGIFSLIPILIAGGLSDFIGVGKVIVGIGISLFIIGISRIFFEF